MTILIAPDKFKESLDSFMLCKAIKDGIMQVDNSINVISFPMADGGDGFSKVMAHYLETKQIYCNTVDPLGRPLKSSYEWSEKFKIAIIDLASTSGLAILDEKERNPEFTSTYGTGLVIKEAINYGAKKIILGLGGSATNDAGIGILAALGFQFLDKNKKNLKPCGNSLIDIKFIIKPKNEIQTKFIVACDVNNPLIGPNGASKVYAKQKGATNLQIDLLEAGMFNFSKLISNEIKIDFNKEEKMGAAGGTTAGLMLLKNIRLDSGVNIIFEFNDFKKKLLEADYVFTGEGNFDEQTLNGKVIYHISKISKAYNKKVIAICGQINCDIQTIKKCELLYATSICNKPINIKESKRDAYNMVRQITSNLVNLLIEIKK